MGSKDATRYAFKVSLITDGELWMAMIQSRNASSYTYDEEVSATLFTTIVDDYYPLFLVLSTVMAGLV